MNYFLCKQEFQNKHYVLLLFIIEEFHVNIRNENYNFFCSNYDYKILYIDVVFFILVHVTLFSSEYYFNILILLFFLLHVYC